MAGITIRNLEDGLKRRLRIRVADHGLSMEEEVRQILRAALKQELAVPSNLASAIRARFAPLGGVELDLPPREPIREAPPVRLRHRR